MHAIGFNRLALVIQRKPVIFHIIKKHRVGSPALGEHHNRRGHPGIRFEYARRKRDNGFQLVVIHQQFTQRLVGFAGTEQDAIRHHYCAAPTEFQHAQHQRDEKKVRSFWS